MYIKIQGIYVKYICMQKFHVAAILSLLKIIFLKQSFLSCYHQKRNIIYKFYNFTARNLISKMLL